MSDKVKMPTIGRVMMFTPNRNDDFNFKHAQLQFYPAMVVGIVEGTSMLILNVFTDNEEQPNVIKTNVSYQGSELLERGQEFWSWPSY